jgi:SpoVK/Ycf46/Vps4 family AAA+-type ATPase
MTNPPIPTSNELLATGGGNATAGGVSFQAEVGAMFGVQLLGERRMDVRLGLGDVRVRSLRFETEAPVDDILAETDSGGWVFVQAKSALTLSAQSDSELGHVADQIVRQYHASAQGDGARGWDRPLQPGLDRILIAVGRGAAATITDHLAAALNAMQASSAAPLPGNQRNALDLFTARLHDAWLALTGTDPSDSSMQSLLSYVRVCKFDFQGADRQLAVECLGPLLRDEHAANAGFTVLAQRCQRLMETRQGTDAEGLRRDLAQEGLAPKAAPSFQRDVEALQTYSDSTEMELGHYEETKVGDDEIRIDRQCTKVVISSATAGSLLIIGEPGSGKSAVLNAAAKALRDRGHDVVTLAVDRLSVNSSDELQRQLEVTHPVREILRNWSGAEPAFVFIDALDATRGGSGDAVFRNLIKDILEIGGRWRVVASIRTFDLRLGEQFGQLFQGAPPDALYADGSFRDVRHIHIPHWTPEELEQLLELAPQIATAITRGGKPLRDLALVPFNTRLLADLISGGLPPEDFGGIRSQVQLLQLYWRRRVVKHGTAAEQCLQRVISEMVTARALRANRLSAAGSDPIIFDTLLHENVLVLLPGERHVAFRHHILFDYAASRVYLDPHDISATAALLSSKSDLGLMLAPALAFALESLWIGSGTDHTAFWSAVVTIAGAIQSDPIARSVAARVASEFPTAANDMRGLSEALRGPEDRRRTAVAAFSHIVGALAIRLEDQAEYTPEPWCYLAAEVHIGADTIWPLRTLLFLLTSRDHTPDCRSQLGTAARGLLHFALDHPDLPSHLTAGAIGFVADTYLSDIAASTAVLRRLLEPARIRDHGHEDLPWLARKIRTVWEADADFAVEIYTTIFGTVITDRQETSIGRSRILPLTSNRRQDFGMAGFALKEAFPKFLSANPPYAVSALIRAFERHVSITHPIPAEAQSWDFTVNGHHGQLIEDGSRYWAWNPSEEHGDNTAALLKAFVERLRTLPEPDVCELAGLVIQSNRLAVIWSRLFMVAAQRPAELGGVLWPYAIQPQCLLLSDTHKDAVDLIAARYPFEAAPTKEALENTAFSLDFSNTDKPERQRQVFLFRLFRTIGRDQLVTAEARSFLDQHEADTAPRAANPRPFSIEVSSHAPEKWWWLKKQGVDVETPLNADLLTEADRIKSAFGLAGAPAAQISDIPAAISSLRALADAASTGLAAGAARSAADYAAGMAAAGAQSLAHLEPARLCDHSHALSDLVALTLELTNHPEPEAKPEQEARFEDNQSWGFPAARIDAAEAAIILCRLDSQTAKHIEPRLHALLQDSHPAVRFVISEHLPALWETDREQMWRLARQVAETESNRGVLRFFANSCLARLLHADPAQVESLVIILLTRARNPEEKPTAELLKEIGTLVAILWVWHARAEAKRLLKEWLASIPGNESELSHAIAAIREALVLGYGNDDPVERAIRERAQQFAAWTAEASAVGLERYLAAATGGLPTSDDEGWGSASASILNNISDQLYFASGAFRGGQREGQVALDEIASKKAFLADTANVLRRIGDGGPPRRSIV